MKKSDKKIVFFSTKSYDREYFEHVNSSGFHFDLLFYENRLRPETAALAQGADAVCAFVNDDVGSETISHLKSGGCELIAMRSAGYNNVDLNAAHKAGLGVVRVPAYSPHAVAEHVIALLQTLNRKTHRAYNRVREGNFALHGLLGFDIFGKTVGIVGTGQIGSLAARIFKGFGCRVLASDQYENSDLKKDKVVDYVPLRELFEKSDIISLHVPLTDETRYMINADSLALMKKGVCLINTSRGGLIETKAVLEGLKSGKIGLLGLDVYENEAGLFFTDRSSDIIQDDVFQRLTTFPNVLITGHQAFFTDTALHNIAETTLGNIQAYFTGDARNLVRAACS